MLSLEVLRKIHDLLHPGGVLALNFVGYEDGPHAEATFLVARTVRAVFSRVRTFRDSPPGTRPREPSNLIFFAADAPPLEFPLPEGVRFENGACERVLRSFQQWEVLTTVPPGALITDGRNPLASLQLPVAEAHFRAMNESFHPRSGFSKPAIGRPRRPHSQYPPGNPGPPPTRLHLFEPQSASLRHPQTPAPLAAFPTHRGPVGLPAQRLSCSHSQLPPCIR